MLVIYLLILMVVLWIHQRWKYRHIYEMASHLKSGLRALPIVGHGYLFIGSNETRMKTLQLMGRDALKQENGLSAFWQGFNFYTMVADPVAAEFITKSCLEKDSIMEITRKYLGYSSIFAPVRIWRPRRKVMIHCFAPTIIKQFLPVFIKNSDLLIQKLEEVAGTGVISIWKYITAFTIDVAAETTFGHELQAQNDSENLFLKSLDVTLKSVGKRLISPWLQSDFIYFHLPDGKEDLRIIRNVWQFVLQLIISKRKEILDRTYNKNKDLPSETHYSTFLEMLLQPSKVGNSYSDTEIKEELLAIVVAGTDTSAVGSSFTCLMLSRHPEVQQKVCEELQDVFGHSDRTPTLDDLSNLKYLEAVLKESLRLYPPVPVIVRQLDKDLILPSGFKMVSGTRIMINIWAIHRNRHYWGEDAEQFRPERFIDITLKNPAAFMPFSYGPRNCIGYQYAMMSMKIVISSILRNFKVLPVFDLPCSEQPPLRLQYDMMMKDVDKFQLRLKCRV